MKLPQLTLRELFLLVVIAAMGCGWWRAELRAQAEAESVDALAKEMEKQLQAIADEQYKASDGTEYSGYKVEVIRNP